MPLSLAPLLAGAILSSFLGGLFSDDKEEELKRLHETMRQEHATVETLTRQNEALFQELTKAHDEKEQLQRLVAGASALAIILLIIGTGIGSHVKRAALLQLEDKEPRHVYDLS